MLISCSISNEELYLLNLITISFFAFLILYEFMQVATWSRHQDKVNLLLVFGDHILSIDVKGNLFIWSLRGDELNLEPVGHILLDDKFTPTCIMHPDTYLNKVTTNLSILSFPSPKSFIFKVIFLWRV